MNKGRTTTTRPIPIEVVQVIKRNLQDDPRELAYFVVMCNSSLRVGDLLSLTRENLRWEDGRAELSWTAQKTGKRQVVLLNEYASETLKRYLDTPHKTSFLFEGTRGRMRSAVWGLKIKQWCKDAGWEESRVSNHSTRKTFVRTHVERGTRLPVLMEILGHSSERQTLVYAGIMRDDIKRVFSSVI